MYRKSFAVEFLYSKLQVFKLQPPVLPCMFLKFWKIPEITCSVEFLFTDCYVTYEFQSEFTLYSLPECQGTPCSTQAPYLKFECQQQRDQNPQPLSKWKLNHLAKMAKGRVLVYQLSVCGFESHRCHLNYRSRH